MKLPFGKKAEAPAPAQPAVPMTEKPTYKRSDTNATATPYNASSRASIAPSTRSSTYVDDIKHEVMVNYLYQQQQSNLWIHEVRDREEGVLIKKARDLYIGAPSEVVHSQFGWCVRQMNVPVRSYLSKIVNQY